ncbi:hypothetical protein KS876_004537 [Vibrio parahaemolyticus]|nr:hypothetical protein [Vibrio parahaemolyticus]ELA9435303.1 hypothetical protein [Vibrio parahaemolyticus]
MDVTDRVTLLDAISEYCNELEYQHGNKHRIGAFLSLINVCSYYESKHFLYEAEELGYPKKPILIGSFFGHVKAVCEQSLMFFICSEVSNAVQARPLGALLEQLLKEGYYDKTIQIQGTKHELTSDSFEKSFDSLQDLFVNRYDQTVGAHILDFNISMFSSFETWIAKISDCYEREMTEKYTLSRLNKCREYLNNYEQAKTEEEKTKYFNRLRTVPGNYLSFPDKLNFVMEKAKENNYPRNLKRDREIIDFLRISRNSVHNGGIHKGNDLELTYKGVTHSLKKNKPMYHEDYNNLIDLYSEVIDMYDAIITVLKDDVDRESLRTLSTDDRIA